MEPPILQEPGVQIGQSSLKDSSVRFGYQRPPPPPAPPAAAPRAPTKTVRLAEELSAHAADIEAAAAEKEAGRRDGGRSDARARDFGCGCPTVGTRRHPWKHGLKHPRVCFLFIRFFFFLVASFDPYSNGLGCQNRFGIPFWLVGEFSTHFRAYFSGWIGMFTGGTIWLLTHGPLGDNMLAIGSRREARRGQSQESK